MSGIDGVFERLINEPEFREQIQKDPASALAQYDLSEEDLKQLVEKFTRESGSTAKVEERVSKSALINLFASLIGSPGGSASEKILDTESMQYSEFADPGDPEAAGVARYQFDNSWPVKSGPSSGQGSSPADDLEAVGFNPQPEPPASKAGFTSDLEAKGFNPQPDPPGAEGFTSDLEAKGFNPQPDPPGAEGIAQKVAPGGEDLSTPEESLLGEGDTAQTHGRINKIDAFTIKQGIAEGPGDQSELQVEGSLLGEADGESAAGGLSSVEIGSLKAGDSSLDEDVAGEGDFQIEG